MCSSVLPSPCALYSSPSPARHHRERHTRSSCLPILSFCPNPFDQAQTFVVNAGSMWPAVLACTQRLARSLPSLEDEAGPDGVAATLRQLPTADPSQYPEYEPPLMAAKQRLIQRRRAEDAVAEAQVKRRMNDEGCPQLFSSRELFFWVLPVLVILEGASPPCANKGNNCWSQVTTQMLEHMGQWKRGGVKSPSEPTSTLVLARFGFPIPAARELLLQ